MADKFPMQADGAGTEMKGDENGELASRRDVAGESGGGAYPNPHEGAEDDAATAQTFSGGQSKGKPGRSSDDQQE